MSPRSPRPALAREIWVLAGAALLIALGYGIVAPVLPQFARSFDVSVAAASFVVSVFALARLLVVLIVSALAGVGAGMLNPAQQATIADVVGQERSGGKVLAGFQMAQDAGAILGPVLAGALADRFGYGVAFAASGAITLLAAAGWVRGRETLHSAGQRRR